MGTRRHNILNGVAPRWMPAPACIIRSIIIYIVYIWCERALTMRYEHREKKRMITITNERVVADLLPELGGALARLTWQSIELLRAAPPACDDVKKTACFPLVPFANRIADGRFCFEGTTVQLPTAARGDGHALHGIGWLSAWQVTGLGGDWAELQLLHDGTDWPWRFEARQGFRLLERGLEIVLTIVNRDERAMPAGLGLHPYFRRTTATRVTTCITGAWHPDERGLATVWQLAPRHDLATGGLVELLAGTDSCCAGWAGETLITGDNIGLVVRSSVTTPHMHLYIPLLEDHFCIEPVTHAPDALNRHDVAAMAKLAPNEAFTIRMRIEALAGVV